MQRGTPISEKGRVAMPRRKYPPLEADADGVLWCSQCDLPPMGQRDDAARVQRALAQASERLEAARRAHRE